MSFFNSVFKTILSSIEVGFILYVPGRSVMTAFCVEDNLLNPSFLSTVTPG